MWGLWKTGASLSPRAFSCFILNRNMSAPVLFGFLALPQSDFTVILRSSPFYR